MTDITMPALSPTMEEGNLAKWHVKVGDAIEPGQVIAEIETDKATMEVEAVDEGVIEALLVEEGAQGVKVNTPIARLKGDGEARPTAKAEAKPQPSVAREQPPAPSSELRSSRGLRSISSSMKRSSSVCVYCSRRIDCISCGVITSACGCRI